MNIVQGRTVFFSDIMNFYCLKIFAFIYLFLYYILFSLHLLAEQCLMKKLHSFSF